ncbi:MAG: endoribonuclease MazF [Acholeplasma sp.]|jgi:mRNA interferase MazF|nr:endoribonuclease MazF [Acholeplasma sp.]
MVAGECVPKAGDFVWLTFTPQAGHEQSGRRPALVLTKSSYNAASGLMLACPVTTRDKGYPFNVSLPEGLPVSGVILADQVRSLDWRERRAEPICPAPKSVFEEVRAKVAALLGL